MEFNKDVIKPKEKIHIKILGDKAGVFVSGNDSTLA
jgi:hypothetical protein